MMEKKDVVKYFVVGIIFVSLIGSLIVLRGVLTGFAIFGSSDKIGAFAQTQIFSDGFESGGMSGWSLSHAAGAADWTASTTNPYQGSYHAFGRPMDTDDPACTMERTISTLGYNTINFSYYRKLNLGTALHTFRAKWFDGSTWTAVEDVTGSIADSSYVSKSFLLPSGANNNPNFAIKFECTEGTTTKNCNIDNINIYGDEIITDTTAPNIAIVYPANSSHSSDNGLDVNYSVSDTNLQACWYSNDSFSLNITLSNCANITSVIWAEGLHNIKIWANDSAGNLNSSSISFVIDTTKPSLSLNSPLNQNYNTNSILVNISASDINLNSVWFYNGSTNISYNYGYYLFNQGSNTIIAYANDSAGNLNSSSVNFFVDSITPVINIFLPQEGASYGYNNSIGLNYTAFDVNLQSCLYNLDNGNNITLLNCQNTTFSVAGNGNYVLNLYANDSLGNLGGDSVSFSVNVGAPTIILNSPIDVYLNSNSVTFSYTPIDIDLQSCELWGNFDGEFKLNQTDNSLGNGSVNIFSLSLNDGDYLWNIKCVDNAGHSAFNGNKTFYVDTINPSVSLTHPTGTKTSKIGISATWQVSDVNLNACWYNVYRGASPEIANNFVNCSLNVTTFEVSGDGSFTFNFYVNDSAGNTNSASSSFSVDTSSQPPIQPPSGGGGGGGGSIYNVSKTGKLSVSLIGDIIARGGDKKTFSLNVKNIGKIFLNNCRLIAKGDISSWIYSTSVKGIAPGQNVDFVFDLNVPEETAPEINRGSLEVKCEEVSDAQNISVSIPEEMGLIEIKDIKQEGNILKINYVFNSSKFVGDSIDIEIWLADENETELKRMVDKSPVNKEGLIDRNVKMQLPGGLEGGVYFLYFAFSSDASNFVKKPVVLSVTGRAILDSEKGKFWVYILFLLIIGIAIFFIWRRHGKADKTNKQNHNASHEPNWLLRKKK